jgi:NAD(P)-dependent dehydrogenase (short-subunit alcohol dehydrogenase family)
VDPKKATRQGSVVVVGATSKWHTSEHGVALLTDAERPLSEHYGLGGALAEAYGLRGYPVFVTSRSLQKAEALATALDDRGITARGIEMDVADENSVTRGFRRILTHGQLDTVIYNIGHAAGRVLNEGQRYFDQFPSHLFDTAVQASVLGPFNVAKEAMRTFRAQRRGTFLVSNNVASLRGRQRKHGESLYYLRGSMRNLAQALAEEYGPLGVHVANVVIDGMINSAGTRYATGQGSKMLQARELAEAFVMLSEQGPSVWTTEIQLSNSNAIPNY